jgi:hypothetical protein
VAAPRPHLWLASLVVLALAITPTARAAPKRAPVSATPVESHEPEPNAIAITLGGQAGINAYNSFLKVGVGYERWLKKLLWLDVGLTTTVQSSVNAGLCGGVRWWFCRAPGACPFVRAFLELAVLHDSEKGANAVALTPRGGGGIGWFSSPGFGITIEANTGLGIAFGGGVHLAAAVDILVGVEFRF